MIQDEFCERLLIEAKIFTVPELIARWCNIPEDEIQDFILQCEPATQNSKGAYYLHSGTNKCFDVKMDYFVKAIDENRVVICDETGAERATYGNIAGRRTRISGKRAREFFENEQVVTGVPVPDFLIPLAAKKTAGAATAVDGAEGAETIHDDNLDPRERKTFIEIAAALALMPSTRNVAGLSSKVKAKIQQSGRTSISENAIRGKLKEIQKVIDKIPL